LLKKEINKNISDGAGMDDREGFIVRLLIGSRHFFPSTAFQTGYGDHPAFYPMGTGGSFPRGKEAAASN
jgi:hypothetical protein